MIFIPAPGPLTPVLFCEMVAVVGGVGLSGEHIAAVTLVAQNAGDAAGGPLDVPEVGLAPQGIESVRNFLRGIAVEAHIKRQFYGGSLFGVDGQVPFAVVGVAQQLRRQRDAVVQAHPQGRLHAAAADMGLLLRHMRKECECLVRGLIQGENLLRFKEHAHRRVQPGQVLNNLDT